MNVALQELERCTAFYKTLDWTDELQETSRQILLFLESLEQFAKGSVKRCKDKNLEEASQLLARLSRGFWELDRDTILPLVRCVLTCQMGTTTSSSLFCRLEKMVGKLSEQNKALVSEELNKMMDSLIEDEKPMSSKVLQTVSLFLEESSLGHQYWKKNLLRLLKTIAATFDFILQDQISTQVEWHYITIKVCLHLFKGMSEEIQPLVWEETGHSEILQKILRSLVHTIMDQNACKDNRLLAGTTVSMMVNTAPEFKAGARAILDFYLLMNFNGCSVAQRTDEHKGGCQFGALWIPTSIWSPDGLEKLVMTRGLLTCCKKEILSCLLDDTPQKQCLLLDILFPAILDLMEKPSSCPYYCFQVFSLWLQRVRESLDNIWKVKENLLLGDNSALLQRLNKIVWNNAESPTEGVSDFVRSSFEILLEIYSLERDHFADPERPLFREYLQRVIFMPWETKARYFALIAILPYLGPEKVLDIYRDLPQHLFNCLSTNRLCPVASDLYKTLLQLQRKAWTKVQDEVSEKQLAHKWAQRWLLILARALTSSDSFLQSNASSHLLGWTLRLFPASYALLATRFGGADASHLRAWVSLLSVQKTIAGDLLTDRETLKRLTCCLFSKEENVRLAALGFLCSAPRTSQALSEREIQLLKEFLPLNLSCDSSSFRQLLQATVMKALVRMRESSLAVLRQQTVNKKECLLGKDRERGLLQAVDFVDWLLQLCMTSLMSGSNYQRRKTALLLLAAIMETFTDTWRPERRKGQPPRNMATLLCWSRSKGYWDFFSTGNTLALLSCLQDSTNEIRELASELLICYFPPAFPESTAVALFEWALEALSSPRVQDSEAGAVLMKTLLHKLDRHVLKLLLMETEKGLSVPCKYLCFLEHLLNVLQKHFVTACHDLLLATHTTPIHGVILTLRRCLLEVPEAASSMLEAQKMQHWRLFFQCLVMAMRDISNLLLGVLQGNQASNIDQATSPSFADMGNAIGSLIRLGKGLGPHMEEDDPVLLSEEHSLILTCCWVSVKEIGLLLGGLAEKVLSRPLPSGCEPLIPLQVVNMAAKTFQDILLKCRHWGAVEGCSVGFTKFCTTLLSHPSPELQNIPGTMLTQGLDLLNSPRGSSITRRAAGFPMLFLCIVAGEDPAKSRPLLAHCIWTLLTLALEPISHSSDQTVDLPQVSAVHVLQTLVRGSNLGPALQQYITSLMMLVLKALSSSSWAMRNAANQLFGALTIRLLGQKWSRDDGQAKDGVSPEALFGRYPHLRSILLGELTLAVEVSISEGSRRGKFHLCPSLYAVLTFLAKLQPSRDTQDSTLTCFLEPLIQLSGNPIYAVRVMAAKALLPFIPATDYGNILLRLASRIPQPEAALSHNALHGCLLQIQATLNRALSVDQLSPDLLHSIACMMENHIWLLMDIQQCPLICAVYLQVLSLLLQSCSLSFVEQVWELLCRDLASPKPGFSPFQLGSSIFCQQAVNFLCSEATRQESPERMSELSLLLQKGNIDVQAAVLTWVLDNKERKGLKSSKELQLVFMEKFREILKNTGDPTLQKLYLKVFVYLFGSPLAQRQPFPGKSLATECGEILLSMVESDRESPELRDHALCVATLFLSQRPEDDPLWERWVAVIEQWSDSLSAEVFRMAAAKALNMGGPDWIRRVQKSSGSLLPSRVLRLIETAIHLLQDEDQEVRHEAASFASHLVQMPPPVQQVQPYNSCLLLQSTKALQSLLRFLLETLGDHPSTFASLMHHLPMVELSETLMELETQGAVSLYKEDEPNVYAEPAIFSQMLLPFLLQLVGSASTSTKLWEPIQSWLETTGARIISTIQFCRQWWSQEDSPCLHLKALSCPKVHSAITALLVKAILAVRILEVLETENQPNCIQGISISSQELSCTIQSLQKLLLQRGIAITVKMEL
ncbi:thyroid adenoma-associated protein homolog isoform X1 [Python bivittatus]|uniref:Thyroid adenoma-associated protein homolog isoform X1 n=1 Tax=Python bivittatus TaxID=176946 RepID=A0A9F2WB65_PYTBI|nr:thyroid adenoma-associated protein homolog isoform X1 [Python bivittatus]